MLLNVGALVWPSISSWNQFNQFLCVTGQWSSASTCVTESSSTSSSLPLTHLGERPAKSRTHTQLPLKAKPDSGLVLFLSRFRLNLRDLGPLAAHMRWFVWLMAAAGTIYVFNYHEKWVSVQTAAVSGGCPNSSCACLSSQVQTGGVGLLFDYGIFSCISRGINGKKILPFCQITLRSVIN